MKNAHAKRKARRVKLDQLDLAPGIRAGMTEGLSAEEALLSTPEKPHKSGVKSLGELARGEAQFIAVPNDTIIFDPAGQRRMNDVDLHMTDERKRRIVQGYMCIQCGEPFEESYPRVCDVCSFPVRDQQPDRVLREFVGDVHVGPSKPLREILEEREEQAEKHAFEKKRAEGGSPMKGLRKRA